MKNESALNFFNNMERCIRDKVVFDSNDISSETYKCRKNHLRYDYKESYIVDEKGMKVLITEYYWEGKLIRTIKNRKYFYRRKDGLCSIQ
jgi:hypothetical protein